jgi:uncharacterized protein YkwD
MRHSLLLLVFVMSVSLEGCVPNNQPKPKPPLSTPMVQKVTIQIGANCPATSPIPPGNMTATEQTLLKLINDFRGGTGLKFLQPDAAGDIVGVAQWHAKDMAAHNAVAIVGSDGEDAFTHLGCAGGGANAFAGVATTVIALGYTTDPKAALNALLTNPAANAAILDPSQVMLFMGVGYSNGYWMIIMN